MKKVRFGIIGAGGIADRRTMPGMMLAKNAEIYAVMEVLPENAEELKKKYNAKFAYTDAEELLKNPDIDAVYIASPVVYHASQAMMAADYGKHVLIEKPIALTYAEGKRVLDYCESKGVLAAAGFMMRFGSHATQMRRAVKNGDLGKVISAFAQFSCYCPPESGNWRFDKKKSGGGALMDMGVHCIDLMEYILDTRVKRLACLSDSLAFDSEVEDTATLMMEMKNGAQCVVHTSFACPDETAPQRLELYGTLGRLVGNGILSQRDGGDLYAIFTAKNRAYNALQDKSCDKEALIEGDFGNLYTKEVESFADSILNGTPLTVPANDALLVQKAVELAYRSSDENKFFNI